MSPANVSPSSDRSQFDTAVRRRSWEWLLALRRRLDVDLQIVDDAQVPLLGPAAAPIATDIGALLVSGPPGLRLALSTAMRTRTPQAASVEWVQTVCLPLTMGHVVGGALILARRSSGDVTPERARGELELIGFWLSNAIEAHLGSPSAEEGELDRVSSLSRVLGDTASRGSDRALMAAFAETLAVWHDLEVYGYVETARGEFVREVSLAGADPSTSPAAIPRTSIPEGAQVSRFSQPDVERLGFAGTQELLMARLDGHAGAWLVVVCGAIASHEVARLGLYFALLDQSIVRATATATARVVASMAKHLLDDEVSPEEQARRAVHEMQKALGISSAGLIVATVVGAPLVRVGSTPAGVEGHDPSDGRQLVIARRSPAQYTMAISVGWSGERHLTQQEYQVAHASADLLESWVRRLVRQSKDVGERRAAARSYDEVLERFAQQAVDSGVPVTAVVLSFGDAVFKPGITQTRVGKLRELVRAGDLVGRLGEGEIGMLLHNTPGGQARSVAARLRQVLLTAGDVASPVPVSVGFASRGPGEPPAGPLAQEARKAVHNRVDES